MKKTLKKAMASVVAGVTLAVGMTAMSSNAYWGSNTFNDGTSTVTAYLSVSSTSVYGYTSANNYNYKTVVLLNYGSGTGVPSGAGSSTKVVAQIYGSGYTHANSSHSSNGVALPYNMSVYL